MVRFFKRRSRFRRRRPYRLRRPKFRRFRRSRFRRDRFGRRRSKVSVEWARTVYTSANNMPNNTTTATIYNNDMVDLADFNTVRPYVSNNWDRYKILKIVSR